MSSIAQKGDKMSKKSKKLPTMLTDTEIKDLRGTFKSRKRYKTVNRNYLMIEFVLQTGVRITELVNIGIENIDWSTGQVLLDKTKGGDERIVFIDKKLLQELNDYRDSRNEGLLFTTLKNKPVSRKYLDEVIKRKGERAGIKKRILHFHSLRHTFAKRFYERSNYDILLLSKVLGHKNLNTTQIYLQGLNIDEIKKVQTKQLFEIDGDPSQGVDCESTNGV